MSRFVVFISPYSVIKLTNYLPSNIYCYALVTIHHLFCYGLSSLCSPVSSFNIYGYTPILKIVYFLPKTWQTIWHVWILYRYTERVSIADNNSDPEIAKRKSNLNHIPIVLFCYSLWEIIILKWYWTHIFVNFP